MEKLIIWIMPEDKKIQYNQFHVECSSTKEGLALLSDNADFKYKVMGVTTHGKVGVKNQEFINLKFY